MTLKRSTRVLLATRVKRAAPKAVKGGPFRIGQAKVARKLKKELRAVARASKKGVLVPKLEREIQAIKKRTRK